MGYGFEPNLRPNMVALCGCIDGHNITGRGGGGDVLYKERFPRVIGIPSPPTVHIELYRPSMAFPHTTVWGMYGGN